MATSQGTSSSPTPSAKPCYLFELPTELRLDIYQKVYSIEALHAKTPDLHNKIQPSLRDTCTKIYDEAHPVFDAQIDGILRNSLRKLDFVRHVMQVLIDDAEERRKMGPISNVTEICKLGKVNTERMTAGRVEIELVAEERDKVYRFGKVHKIALRRTLKTAKTRSG